MNGRAERDGVHAAYVLGLVPAAFVALAVAAWGMADSETSRSRAQELQKAFRSKKYNGWDWLDLRTSMLEELGRTKDPGAVDFLLDVALRSPHDPLMAAAGGALQHFAGAEPAVRKSIAKDLIKKFAQIEANANRNVGPGDRARKVWAARHRAVADAWNRTLQKLIGRQIAGAERWRVFWNTHKQASWAQRRRP